MFKTNKVSLMNQKNLGSHPETFVCGRCGGARSYLVHLLERKMFTAKAVAEYLTHTFNPTALQVQKALYFANGYYNDLFGEFLLSDASFERWEKGPCDPAVRKHVQGYGRFSFPNAEIFMGRHAFVRQFVNACYRLTRLEETVLVERLHTAVYDSMTHNQIYTSDQIVRDISDAPEHDEEAVQLLLATLRATRDEEVAALRKMANEKQEQFLLYLKGLSQRHLEHLTFLGWLASERYDKQVEIFAKGGIPFYEGVEKMYKVWQHFKQTGVLVHPDDLEDESV